VIFLAGVVLKGDIVCGDSKRKNSALRAVAKGGKYTFRIFSQTVRGDRYAMADILTLSPGL
jgi:hypothetical protein